MAAFVDSEGPFSVLPSELLACVFQYLTVEDLCRVATCSRAWREAANSDVLWRPLCREKGWERYGTVTDLCKEIPFAAASQQQDTGQGSDSVSFPNDLFVNSSAWPGLVDTCKWKEVYMKARHLEANWRNNRFHVVSFEYGCEAYNPQALEITTLFNLDGEGSSLAGCIWNNRFGIWDTTNGHCRNIIEVDASNWRHALKMKNDVIAVGCKDGKIRTYSAQTGEQLHVLSGHRLGVTRLFFDGETIVSFAEFSFWVSKRRELEDSDVRVWSSADGSSRFVFQSVSQGTKLVDLDYLDKTVAVAYDDNTIKLWDVWTGTCKGTIATGENKIKSCHLGNGFVISASEGWDIKMWNLESGEYMKTFDDPDVDTEGSDSDEADKEVIESCIFNGELFVVKAFCSDLMVYNLHGKFVGHSDMVGLEQICFHGNKLITATTIGGANDLWLMDRRSGFTHIKEVRPSFFDEEVALKYTTAWMSDTKLAIVHYFDVDHWQDPKIFVYHYW